MRGFRGARGASAMDGTIGERVRQLRHQQSMTQRELAERAGVSADLISKLEQGQKQTALLVTLHKIAGALDVDVSVLLARPARVEVTDDDGGVLAIRRAAPSVPRRGTRDRTGNPEPGGLRGPVGRVLRGSVDADPPRLRRPRLCGDGPGDRSGGPLQRRAAQGRVLRVHELAAAPHDKPDEADDLLNLAEAVAVRLSAADYQRLRDLPPVVVQLR